MRKMENRRMNEVRVVKILFENEWIECWMSKRLRLNQQEKIN